MESVPRHGSGYMPIQVYIDSGLRYRLRKYCFETEKKQAAVVRKALDCYLSEVGY